MPLLFFFPFYLVAVKVVYSGSLLHLGFGGFFFLASCFILLKSNVLLTDLGFSVILPFLADFFCEFSCNSLCYLLKGNPFLVPLKLIIF